jgi:hypothetical protein
VELSGHPDGVVLVRAQRPGEAGVDALDRAVIPPSAIAVLLPECARPACRASARRGWPDPSLPRGYHWPFGEREVAAAVGRAPLNVVVREPAELVAGHDLGRRRSRSGCGRCRCRRSPTSPTHRQRYGEVGYVEAAQALRSRAWRRRTRSPRPPRRSTRRERAAARCVASMAWSAPRESQGSGGRRRRGRRSCRWSRGSAETVAVLPSAVVAQLHEVSWCRSLPVRSPIPRMRPRAADWSRRSGIGR